MVRRAFSFVCALLLMWGVIFVYTRVTDGFSVREMQSTLTYDAAYEASTPPRLSKNELKQAFSQEYRYLGKGCQSYVFESQDKNYVLKFFKHKHLRSREWLNALPIPPKYRPYCDEKIAIRKERVKRLFLSCKLAFEELANETELLYLHLNKSAPFRKLVVRDKLGIKHTIELGEFEFVLQRRALQVDEVFAGIESEDEAKKRIAQLITVVKERCEKGIANNDRSFAQNVAFSANHERALFIDIGQFVKDPKITSEEATKKELKRRLGGLHFWMEKHYPQYAPLVLQEMAPFEQ